MIWIFALIGLTFPFLPVYFSSIGLSDSKIAILLAIPPLVMLVTGQLVGYLTDIHMNQKSVLALLCLFGAGVYAFFPFVRGFPGLMVLMTLHSIALRPCISLANSLVLATSDGERRFGLLRSLGSVSFVVASTLVGVIADGDAGNGLAWMFPMGVAVNLVAAATAMTLRDVPMGHGKRVAGNESVSFWAVQREILSEPIVRVFLAFTLVSQLGHGAGVMFQSRLITAPDMIGGGNVDVAIAMNIGAVAEIVVFLFFNRILARVRLMPLFLIAVLAQVVRWGAIWAVPELWVVHATNVLHIFTFGLMHICTVVLINRETAPHLRASGQALLSIVYMTLGGTLSQVVAAAFFTVGDVHQFYGLAALLAIPSLPLWWRMKTLYERKHKVSGFWIRR